MYAKRSIWLSTFLAALFAASMAVAEAPGDQADHAAHHPSQQEQSAPQTQPNPQVMGCPMMAAMMGSGTKGAGMTQGDTAGGMGALFGSRVTPPMNLSVDDVRSYLAVQLDHLKNKRLKVGEVRSDDANITADIVTVDDSLVQRLKVDRHTGTIQYEN